MTEECQICTYKIHFKDFIIFECNTNHKSCKDCFNKISIFNKLDNKIKCPFCRSVQNKDNNVETQIIYRWEIKPIDPTQREFYRILDTQRIKLF